MIWLRHENPKEWELEYYGPGGAFLKPLLELSSIKSLALKRGFFSGSSVNFLRGFGALSGLTLIDWKLKDARSIEHLTNLKKLRLQTPALSGPVNLEHFPQLEDLSVENADLIINLESCVNLKRLFISKLKSDVFSSLNSLQKLEVAQFSEPAFHRIGSVNLLQLESLTIKAAHNLEDWNGLEGLPALKKLWLFGAPRMRSLDALKCLQKLEWLLLEDCGRIESLAPIVQLPQLCKLNIIGNTRIIDGRVSSILKAPSLKEVTFPSRPSYDMTEEQANEIIYKR